MNPYAEKVAIVTGGGMGLGRALCGELARRGAVVIPADIDAEAATAVAASIVEAGGQARGHPVDVSQRAQVEGMIEAVIAEHGRLDYIFNNAAIVIGGDTRDLTLEQYDQVIGVDLRGVVFGAVAAYQAMAKRGQGHIVNISSLSGLVPQPLNTAYSTSKWGVLGLSLGLRFEGVDLGVKVSCVCPGDMKTDIYKNMTVVGWDRAVMEKESRRTHFLLPQWTAAHAARVILEGVARNRAMIVFPMIGRVAWMLMRWQPAVVYWLTMRRVRMFRGVGERYRAS